MAMFQNRPMASSSDPSARTRLLWRSFEQSLSRERSQMEGKVRVAQAKADQEYHKTSTHLRMPESAHKASKAIIAKGIKEAYFEKVRSQWQAKLLQAGLKPEQWSDMTPDEMRAVGETLGGVDDESDEDLVVVQEVPQALIPEQPPTSFFQPLAPSFSVSSRSTNLSSSSYAIINPSEFNSEDEDHDYGHVPFLPVATSHDLTSEDDSDTGYAAPAVSRGRANTLSYTGWGRENSAGPSSQKVTEPPSIDPFVRPLASDSAHNTAHSRMAPPKRPQDVSAENGKPVAAKVRVPQQPYIGPSLSDHDEPIDEEEEFEKFKMQTRMQKILEFHEAAARAEVQLSVELYRARKAQNNSKEDAPRVLEHQRRMVQLQLEKEEQRKAIVKAERTKRRSELRRRPVREAAAPQPSHAVLNPSWLTSFQDQMPSELESTFDLEAILSEDPSQQHNNVEDLVNSMFSGASFFDPTSLNSTGPTAFQRPSAHFDSVPSNNSFASSSQSIFQGYNTQDPQYQMHQAQVLESKNKSKKPARKAQTSLFGESSDEEDNMPTGWTNSHPNGTEGAFMQNHVTDNLGESNSFASWGEDGNDNPMMQRWAATANLQTPTMANSFAARDAVTGGWGAKKPAAPTPQAPQARQASSLLERKNPFGMTVQSEPQPGATPAPISAVARGKKPMVPIPAKHSFFDDDVVITKPSPLIAEPAAPAPPSKSPAAKTSTIPQAVKKPVTPPPPAPAPGKKLNKKQRLAATKKGGPAAAEPTQSQAPSKVESPKAEPVVVEQMVPAVPELNLDNPEPISWMSRMIPGMSRVQTESVPPPSLDDVATTPRPAAKIPAHLQEALAPKSEGTPRPGWRRRNTTADVVGSTPSPATFGQMSQGPAMKGSSMLGSATITPASRSLWGMGMGKSQIISKVAELPSGGDRAYRFPGGFENADEEDDDDDGGGGGGDDGGVEDVSSAPQVWQPTGARPTQVEKTAAMPVKQQPPSLAAQRLRGNSEIASSSPAPRILGTKGVPAAQPQAIPSPSNAKKTRAKKNGKGKRVTIEDVPDEESDNVDVLPIDSKTIFEEKVILEPKPSVAPGLFHSIIDYEDGDEDETGGSSSSFAPTPSTAPSSPPDDIFGDQARLAAAIRELQGPVGGNLTAANAKHKRWTPAADGGDAQGSTFFSPMSRLQGKASTPQVPIWGQPNPSKDQGKGKMSETNGTDEMSKFANQTIQGLKRSKPGAGGKLL
ncbi:hypothetical protein B0H34DRAFT_486251 [Crassisporium funariophilum]|nr:hypothetical protein B0H34DRAFT_486251 [Crassisporium funariophilum]